MDLKIFDVEHGACAMLTCDDNSRMMIDAGHNATSGWRPGSYLRAQGVSQLETLQITNFDEDHASGIANLFDNINVLALGTNTSVSPTLITHLKSTDGMGPGIERLVREMSQTFIGPPIPPGTGPAFSGLVRTRFWNTYPDFDDENNLSMVVHLSCHGKGVLFPGDLEKAGWLKLLQRQDFRTALQQTSVFVASHHGRENGCCDEVFELCKPYFVVISDKGYAHDTQLTVPYYRARARGGSFRGEQRHVLTTRNDGRIGFQFSPESWNGY